MNTLAFVSTVDGFDKLSPREKIKILCWHLHTHKGADLLTNAIVRDCFRELALEPSDLSVYLPRMADSKPPELLRVKGGYKMHGSLRRELDEVLGPGTSSVRVAKMLSELPSQVPDLVEQGFLAEALLCYRVGAFRAAVVMTWNLAFDHLLSWIVDAPARVSSFNSAIPKRYPKSSVRIATRIDFEELKEAEIIEICNSAGLFSKNITEIMREKLKRRNMAAHPTQVVIVQSQADDVITDLVNNVVLGLR